MPSTEAYITQSSGDARYQALGSLGSSTPAQVDAGDAGTAGVSTSAARADHEHPVSITSSQLVPAAAIAAWTTWTPTFTNITQGNGTLVARYIQFGKTVHFRLMLTLGTTSAIGADPRFTLPVAAASNYAFRHPLGPAHYLDAGVAEFIAYCQLWSDTATAFLRHDSGTGGYTQTTSTAPFTWGSTDVIFVTGTYEAA